MSLLDILGQFIGIFVELIPRFARRADATETMIVDSFIFGVSIANSRPVLYIPVLDSVEYWPKNEEPVNTEMQSITTSDGHEITIDTGFSYRITDPIKAREMVAENYVTKAVMIVRGAVRDSISCNDLPDLLEMDQDSALVSQIEESINGSLKEYGMTLTYFCIEDLAKTRNLRHFGVNLSNTNLMGG